MLLGERGERGEEEERGRERGEEREESREEKVGSNVYVGGAVFNCFDTLFYWYSCGRIQSMDCLSSCFFLLLFLFSFSLILLNLNSSRS